MFRGSHERCNLDGRKNGGVEEERKEAGTSVYKQSERKTGKVEGERRTGQGRMRTL